MVRAKGRYRNQTLELEHPLALPEGAQVEVDVYFPAEAQATEEQAWASLGMGRLEEEWDNPEDAIYDDWKTLYGAHLRPSIEHTAAKPGPPPVPLEQFEAGLDELAEGSERLPVLPPQAYSREGIYGDG